MTTFVYVDAKDRTSGNTSDFTVSLAGGETLQLHESTKLRVDNFRICNSFWTVGPQNQFLYTNDKDGERILTLTQGYFSASDLAIMISTKFSSAYNAVSYTHLTLPTILRV